jgi:ABC-type enterochelin transport system substrate-binding protein
MKALLFVLAAATALLTGCGDKNSSKTASSTNSTAGSTNSIGFVTAPMDYLKTAVQEQKNMTKTIDVSYLNEALQRYNVQEGRYPNDLSELVPNYVGKLPVPPYGYKLDYDPNTGTVKVVQQ